MRGKIVRLVRERGFGFIRDESGREIFFHATSLPPETFETLSGTEEVEFDLQTDARDNRERAGNVRVVG